MPSFCEGAIKHNFSCTDFDPISVQSGLLLLHSEPQTMTFEIVGVIADNDIKRYRNKIKKAEDAFAENDSTHPKRAILHIEGSPAVLTPETSTKTLFFVAAEALQRL